MKHPYQHYQQMAAVLNEFLASRTTRLGCVLSAEDACLLAMKVDEADGDKRSEASRSRDLIQIREHLNKAGNAV